MRKLLKSNLALVVVLSTLVISGLAGVPHLTLAVGEPASPSDALPPEKLPQKYRGNILGFNNAIKGLQTIKVWSKSMSRYIPIDLVIPNNRKPHGPILYLVNGDDGGESIANWKYQSDYVGFFANKGTIVAQIMQGKGSYYTDWIKDDPALGRNKWETFLLHEVEKVLEPYLNINPHKRGLIGYSMSASSVFTLQETRPGFYKAVHAYSGCPESFNQESRVYMLGVVGVTGGSINNMWGDADNPLWREKDPVINAAKLRGTDLYIYSGNGSPGKHDILNDPILRNPITTPANLGLQILIGGQLEERGYRCTVRLVNKLRSLNIPIVADVGRNGTHSWGYWIDALEKSWRYMAKSIGGNI